MTWKSPAFDEIAICRVGPAEVCAYAIKTVQGRTTRDIGNAYLTILE